MKTRARQEDGVALITALLAVVILGGFATVFVTRSTTETRATAASQRYETTLHTAEAAADLQIAELNADSGYSSTTEAGAPVELPATVDTVAEEEQWARDLLDDMDEHPTAFVDGPSGQSYAVRPTAAGVPLDVIYAVGATPSFGAPNASIRTVKLRVAQDAYTPDFALLSDGPLTFSGSGKIVHPDCNTAVPETCIADVHTNSEVSGGGSAELQGRLTVSGAVCPAGLTPANGCVPGVDPQPVPQFTARSFYLRDEDTFRPDPEGQTVEWFDLCPDGTVREPAQSGPCTTGAVRWPDSTDSENVSNFRGWEWKQSQHAWVASSLQAGVFYVHYADAEVRGSAGTGQRSATILVSTDPAKPTQSGSLNVSGNPRLHAGLSNVLFIADRDLNFSGTGGSGCAEVSPTYSGFIGVGEQLTVIGNFKLRGAAIVRDAEDVHNLVKRNTAKIQGNMCLEYDDDLSVDLTGIWVVTFWNEL